MTKMTPSVEKVMLNSIVMFRDLRPGILELRDSVFQALENNDLKQAIPKFREISSQAKTLVESTAKGLADIGVTECPSVFDGSVREEDVSPDFWGELQEHMRFQAYLANSIRAKYEPEELVRKLVDQGLYGELAQILASFAV